MPVGQHVANLTASGVCLASTPELERAVMLRSKTDVRSGSGPGLVEALLELRKLLRRRKIVTQGGPRRRAAGNRRSGRSSRGRKDTARRAMRERQARDDPIDGSRISTLRTVSVGKAHSSSASGNSPSPGGNRASRASAITSAFVRGGLETVAGQ